MAYRTWHSLYVYDKNMKYLELESNVFESKITSFCEDDPDNDSGYYFNQELCWENMEKDMREFSKRYPKYIFCIHGEGEESTDLWDVYFKDGKMQICPVIITYPEYNETLLT